MGSETTQRKTLTGPAAPVISSLMSVVEKDATITVDAAMAKDILDVIYQVAAPDVTGLHTVSQTVWTRIRDLVPPDKFSNGDNLDFRRGYALARMSAQSIVAAAAEHVAGARERVIEERWALIQDNGRIAIDFDGPMIFRTKEVADQNFNDAKEVADSAGVKVGLRVAKIRTIEVME